MKKPKRGKMLKRSLISSAAICKTNNESRRKHPNEKTPARRAKKRNLPVKKLKFTDDKIFFRAEALFGKLNVAVSPFIKVISVNSEKLGK
ncbi:MAG TPA: hypothetical protein VF692_15630, partial [Pyrinomonadaceae bacterium]